MWSFSTMSFGRSDGDTTIGGVLLRDSPSELGKGSLSNTIPEPRLLWQADAFPYSPYGDREPYVLERVKRNYEFILTDLITGVTNLMRVVCGSNRYSDEAASCFVARSFRALS